MPLLSIVIPVYNEGGNIRTCLEAIESRVEREHEILIVYDFDEDNTLPAVRELMPSMPCIRLVRNKYGRGVLNAIKTGLETAGGKYVAVTMADLSDPPEVMNAMIDAAEREDADVVCASRYMKGGRQVGGPFLKGLMSRTAGLTLHWFAGLPTHDATNSFKLYRKSYLESVAVESTGGFELGIELTVKAYRQGRKICEVPTTWTDRTAGESHFKIMKWLPGYLRWYFYAFGRKERRHGA
ncbi:MAG: glycosyltransferase [Synergistaceae bacterium]|nr:glycosyltransferase [Synergistaceae bacterium]